MKVPKRRTLMTKRLMDDESLRSYWLEDMALTLLLRSMMDQQRERQGMMEIRRPIVDSVHEALEASRSTGQPPNCMLFVRVCSCFSVSCSNQLFSVK